MKQSKKILTLAVGCITGLLAVPSIAQESRLQVEEIIVTATKRAVSLQDVPIAITAVTSSDIAAAGLESIQDAASMVPNFEFPTSRNPGESDVAIRGISANIPFSSAGFDAGFGVYLDGVYQADKMLPTQILAKSSALKCCVGHRERYSVKIPLRARLIL